MRLEKNVGEVERGDASMQSFAVENSVGLKDRLGRGGVIQKAIYRCR